MGKDFNHLLNLIGKSWTNLYPIMIIKTILHVKDYSYNDDKSNHTYSLNYLWFLLWYTCVSTHIRINLQYSIHLNKYDISNVLFKLWLIGPLGIYFSKIWIQIPNLKMYSRCGRFCFRHNGLMQRLLNFDHGYNFCKCKTASDID